MVWDHPINDSLWINALTLLLIGCLWLIALSVVAVTALALGRGLRAIAEKINDWYERHPV